MMSRLQLYIVKECAIGGLGLFAVLAILAWMTRALRLFDLVTAKGQDIWTLAGQASLISVPLGRETIYICLAVGVARALSAMQGTRELHTIHVNGGLSSLWKAVVLYIAVGTFAVVLITNWLDPLSRKQMIDWSAEIAADLVGRALQPGRFTPVAEGVTLYIGGREADGTIIDFFADDNSDPDNRLTYYAKTAEMLSDSRGYALVLGEGMVQRSLADGGFSSVSFSGHQLNFDRFSDYRAGSGDFNTRTTFDMVGEIMETGDFSRETQRILLQRLGDALKVGALCFFAAAIVAYPTASRRRKWLPVEVLVIGAAFAERTVETMTLSWEVAAHFLAGPLFLFTLGALVVCWKSLFPFGINLPRLAR